MSKDTRTPRRILTNQDVTTAESARLHARIGPMLTYLGRLRKRLDEVGFAPDDSFYRRVDAAYNAVHSLSVETHSMSCKSGVGRPPKE